MNSDHKKAYGLCIYKISKKSIKVLLCKGVTSKDSWGFLKGVILKNEEEKTCAQREVEEESSLYVKKQYFEEYFEQLNEEKDVGIWLVESSCIVDMDDKFIDDKLLDNFLSWENQKVKFFSLDDLPLIRDKQMYIMRDIRDFLQNKH